MIEDTTQVFNPHINDYEEIETDFVKSDDFASNTSTPQVNMETELTFDHAGIKNMMLEQPTYEGMTWSGSAIDMEDDDAKRKLTLYYASKLGVDPTKMNYESAVEAYKGKKYLDTKPAELFRVTRNEIQPVPDDNFTKLQDFNKMTAEEQWAEIEPSDTVGTSSTVSAFGIKVGLDKEARVYTPEEKQELIDKHRGELFIGSEYAVKAQGEKVLSDRAKKYAVDISLGMEVPYQTFTAMNPDEQAIFFPYVRALNPEVDGNNFTKSWSRLTQTFEDRVSGLGRSAEITKSIFQNDVKLFQRMKDQPFMDDYSIESGEWASEESKQMAQQWMRDEAEMESIRQGGYGFGIEDIDVSDKDFQKRLFKGREGEMEFAIQRRINQASRKMYKSEGLLEDIMVEGVAMGADLGATVALSSIPVVGVPLAMGYTSGVFYGDFVDTLVYDHNVSLDEAQSIAGVATIPYALAEMGQAKVLKSAMSLGEKETAKKMMSGIGGFLKRRGTDYAKEVGQESFQAGVELVGKAYAKEFADAEGIEYTDLVQDWWDETIMAMKALVLPTGAGGSIGDIRRMKGGSFGSIQHAQNIAKQVGDVDILPSKDLDVAEKLSDEARAFYTEAQTVEERQEVLDLYAPELTIEQVEQALDREMIVEQLTEDAVADLKQSTGISEQEAQAIIEDDLDTFVQSRAKATKYAKILKHADIEQTGADTFTITGKEGGASTNLKLVESLDEKGHYDIASDTLVLPKNAENFTFTHEFTHAMVDKGLVTQDEFNQLLKYGNKLMKKQGIAGFADADAIAETYQEKFNKVAKEKGTKPVQVTDDIINNEIVAMAMEEGRMKGDAPVEVRNIAQRVWDWVSSMIGYTTQSQKQRQLVQDVFEGKPLQGEAKVVGSDGVRYSIVTSDDVVEVEKDLPVIDPNDLVGKTVIATFADLTKAGGSFEGIDSSKIDKPIPLQGGPSFPLLKSNKDAKVVWASNGLAQTKALQKADYVVVSAMNEDTHVSNATFASSLLENIDAYVKDGKVSKEQLKQIDELIKSVEVGDHRKWEGFNVDKSLYEWSSDLTFVQRAEIVKQLKQADENQKKDLGLPNVQKLIDQTLDEDYAGYNVGENFYDALLIIEVDKSPDGIIELGTEGTKKHLSYKYGVKGDVIGRFAQPVSAKKLFPTFFKKRRDDGKSPSDDRRSMELSKPIETITQEIADSLPSQPHQYIKTPKQAQLAYNFFTDQWQDSSVAKTKGGISNADFLKELKASDASSTLTQYDPKDLRAMTKSGDLKVFKLKDGRVWFGIKDNYSYKDEYGFESDQLTGKEKALVSVVNNQKGSGGVAGPSIVLKAIQEGTEVLDAFAVTSKKFPKGFLPSFYGQFGFKKIGEIPFAEEYYSQNELNDIKSFWKKNGWTEDLPNPNIAVMKWEGSNEHRKNITERYLSEGFEGIEFNGAETTESASATEETLLGGYQESSQGESIDEGLFGRGLRDDYSTRNANRLRGLREELRELDSDKRSHYGMGDTRFSLAPPTDSKAFSNWFGDSKVVNEDGSPKVVYHGTTGDFNSFSKELLGGATGARSAKLGFFFTDYKPLADRFSSDTKAPVELIEKKAYHQEKLDEYEDEAISQLEGLEGDELAKKADELNDTYDELNYNLAKVNREIQEFETNARVEMDVKGFYKGDRSRTIEAYLSIQKPMTYSTPVKAIAGGDLDHRFDVVDFKGKVKRTNYDEFGLVAKDSFTQLREMIALRASIVKNAEKAIDWKDVTEQDVLEALEFWGKSYDGIILENTLMDNARDETMHTMYIAFSPTQIKSATDNVGTYDPANPDIRYAMKPLANAEVLASTYIASKQAEGKPLTDAEIEEVMTAFDIEDSAKVLDNVAKIVDDEDDAIKKATHTSTMRKAIATKANKLAYQDRIRGIATDAKKGGAIYQQAEDRMKRNKLLERELNIQNIKEDKLRDVVDAYKSAIIDDQAINNLPQIEEAIKQEMVKSGLISNRNQKGFKRMPEYRSTLKRTLKDIALELITDLSPSSRKTQLSQQARNLMNYTTTPSIENNFNKLLDKISSSVIKQTQKQLRDELNKTIKPYAKRPKVDVEERKRTVAGQQHLFLYWANQYKGLDEYTKKGITYDKYNTELSKIQSELEKYRDSDQPSEQILFNEWEIREQALVAFGRVDTAKSSRSDIVSANDYANKVIEDGKALVERLDQAHRSKYEPITEDIQQAIEQAKPYVKKRDDKTLVDGLSQMHVRGQLESITAYGTDEQKASLEKVLLANDASKIKKIQLIEEYNKKLIEGVAEIGVDNFDKYQRESSIEKNEYKKYSHEGRTALSDADLMTMHMAFRQPDIVERALRVNDSGELMNPDLKRRYDMWDEMKKDLGAVNIKVAEFMGDLIDEILPQVNETYKKQFGVDMKVQPANYFPLKVQVKKGGFKMYMSGIASAPSFTIARTQNTNDLNERSNIFEVFAGHISEASHYVNTYESSMGIRSTLTNRFTREAIRQTFGDATLTHIDDSVVDMVADRPVVSGESNRSIDTVRSWMSNISIGFNPKSILVALTGTVNAFAVRRGIIDATTSALRNPSQAMDDIKFIYDSIVVQQRKELGINEGMQMARSRAKNSSGFVKAYTDMAYWGLTTMDSWISSVMGGVIYNQYKNSEQAQGLTQEQVEANGLAIVNRFIQEAYQPTSNDFMPADIRRGGSFAKSIFQFLTEPKSKLGIYLKDVRQIKAKYQQGDKQGASRDAVRLVVGQHILIPTAYWMAGELMRMWTGDDDDGALDRLVVAILSGPASGLLVWGTGIEIMFKTIVGDKVFLGSSIPSDRIMQEIQFIIKNATSDDDILEKVDKTIEKYVPVYKKTKQSLEN